jgi:hypothetical protein
LTQLTHHLNNSKLQLLELGIDLNKLIEEKEAELITNGIENELKLLFRNNEL